MITPSLKDDSNSKFDGDSRDNARPLFDRPGPHFGFSPWRSLS